TPDSLSSRDSTPSFRFFLLNQSHLTLASGPSFPPFRHRHFGTFRSHVTSAPNFPALRHISQSLRGARTWFGPGLTAHHQTTRHKVAHRPRISAVKRLGHVYPR
ncbi:hypothetical protein FA95DRAFT_1563974, partial [Auriscalpium vulgare]